MTMKKISAIILGAILLMTFISSMGYAADAAPGKEEAMLSGIPSKSGQDVLKKSAWESFSVSNWAEGIKIRPFASINEAYNDNVFFTTTDKKGDWVSMLSPGLELIDKTERLDALLSARCNGIYYLDQHDLNAVDQFYLGKLRYSLTEKLALGVEAGFTRDSQATREIDTTGIIFPTAVIRKRQNYGASGDWRITEKMVTGISYNYGKDQYDQANYSDLESQTGGLNFVNDLNLTTKGRLNFGYAHYVQTGITVDNYSGTIGVSKALSEIWNVIIDAGAVYSHTDFGVPTSGSTGNTNSGWGPMGQISITGNYEKTNGSLTLNKSVMPVSGATGAANRTSLTMNIKHKFTYELSAYLTAVYIINKSDPGEFSSTGTDQNTTQVSIGPRYDFNKDMFLSASYTYQRVDYNQTNTFADQHLAMLTFNIQYTFFE